MIARTATGTRKTEACTATGVRREPSHEGARNASAQSLVRAAGQRRDLSGELQLDERGSDGFRRETGACAERVDSRWIVSEVGQHTAGDTLDRFFFPGFGGYGLGRGR